MWMTVGFMCDKSRVLEDEDTLNKKYINKKGGGRGERRTTTVPSVIILSSSSSSLIICFPGAFKSLQKRNDWKCRIQNWARRKKHCPLTHDTGSGCVKNIRSSYEEHNELPADSLRRPWNSSRASASATPTVLERQRWLQQLLKRESSPRNR